MNPAILKPRNTTNGHIKRINRRWINYQVPYNEYFSAYIVLSETWKDLHRHIIFLSPSYGLFSVFLYGAVSKRNHLRATVQSFSFGQLRLKQGKTRNSISIDDWYLESPSLLLKTPNSIQVYQNAALWSELLLYSHDVSYKPLFAELRSLLSSVLNFDSKHHCQLANLRFFWQFLLLEGFQPGLSQCHQCNLALPLQENKIFFSSRGELLCTRCISYHGVKHEDINHHVSQHQKRNSNYGYFLGFDEINLLCWAEQDLSSFVLQDELFFGSKCSHYSKISKTISAWLKDSLERLIGYKLNNFF